MLSFIERGQASANAPPLDTSLPADGPPAPSPSVASVAQSRFTPSHSEARQAPPLAAASSSTSPSKSPSPTPPLNTPVSTPAVSKSAAPPPPPSSAAPTPTLPKPLSRANTVHFFDPGSTDPRLLKFQKERIIREHFSDWLEEIDAPKYKLEYKIIIGNEKGREVRLQQIRLIPIVPADDYDKGYIATVRMDD